ncbi:MAG TPA: PDZ domain-containing protein [Longimicrobiales bacterium]|nr:PDZ domain-containing protein [Longimicrobiales bacterium]
MLRMRLRAGGVLGAALALGALTAAGAWTAAGAQEARPRVRVESRDCRCVDRDGKEIENCTCFTMPDVRGILARAVPLRESRVRLGVTITEEVNASDASLGARIEDVIDDGPADEAGLQEDDIITAVDGKSLLTPLGAEAEEDFDLEGSVAVQRLMAIIRDVEPGQEVRVDYLRDGQARNTTVKARETGAWSAAPMVMRWRSGEPRELAEALGEMRGRLRELRLEGREPRLFEFRVPDAPAAPPGPGTVVRVRPGGDFFFGHSGECPDSGGERGAFAAFASRCVGGVALENMNPRLGEYFGTTQGVLVTDVGEDSTLGLEPGDVILEVGDREATDAERVRRIIGSYDDDEPITLRIMRQKREMTVQGARGG